MSDKVYEIITEKILKLLDEKKIPWERDWNTEFPKNLVSKKEYRGINLFLLSMLPYSSPYYVSFKQCKELGGHVRKGEKQNIAVFWKRIEIKDELTGEEKTIPFLRYYGIFNIEQCEGIDKSKIPEVKKFVKNKLGKIAQCEKVIDKMKSKPKITNGGQRAYYSPIEDKIGMPPKTSFKSKEGFYSVLFHELAHSTGHPKRLDRKEGMLNVFGNHEYSKEELVAEMGSAFLSAHCQISNKKLIKNQAAYIRSWRDKISKDCKLVVNAAAKAQKAVDFILNVNHGGSNEIH